MGTSARNLKGKGCTVTKISVLHISVLFNVEFLRCQKARRVILLDTAFSKTHENVILIDATFANLCITYT